VRVYVTRPVLSISVKVYSTILLVRLTRASSAGVTVPNVGPETS